METSTDVAKSATVHAVVTKADGTTVDLGVIAAQYSNPLRQLLWTLVGERRAQRRIQRFNASQAR